MSPDITVILATFNRASDLRRTLEGIARTDRAGLSVECIVVDNGSTDDTRTVIESFAREINARYILEPRNGKNIALNAALDSVSLGDIVVFTDDDVDVPPDWLRSIHSACERRPEYQVFGGRIDVVFPPVDLPPWADDATAAMLAFARHDYADRECEYSGFDNPYGPNYWVRREIFSTGRRYDEEVGPRTENRMMGSETSFFNTLARDGYRFLYVPSVRVGHRIQEDALRFLTVWKRGYRWGRGRLHIYGPPRPSLLRKHPLIWRARQYALIAWHLLKLMSALVRSTAKTRPGNSVIQIIHISYHREALRAAGSGIASGQ